MLRLKSRVNAPIGGFIFIDAPISAVPMEEWGFTGLVMNVINRRLSNPRFGLSTDFNTVAGEVDLQNAQRMQTINGGSNYITDDGVGGAAPPPPFPPAHRSGLQSVAGRSDVMAGAAVLMEWLGAGGMPVAPELSESRAQICAACPRNGSGDWTTYFTAPAAAIIRRQLVQKDGLAVSTTVDARLGVCKACSCPLKLKVHTPLAHILGHTREEVKAQLDPRCWMLSEKT